MVRLAPENYDLASRVIYRAPLLNIFDTISLYRVRDKINHFILNYNTAYFSLYVETKNYRGILRKAEYFQVLLENKILLNERIDLLVSYLRRILN